MYHFICNLNTVFFSKVSLYIYKKKIYSKINQIFNWNFVRKFPFVSSIYFFLSSCMHFRRHLPSVGIGNKYYTDWWSVSFISNQNHIMWKNFKEFNWNKFIINHVYPFLYVYRYIVQNYMIKTSAAPCEMAQLTRTR